MDGSNAHRNAPARVGLRVVALCARALMVLTLLIGSTYGCLSSGPDEGGIGTHVGNPNDGDATDTSVGFDVSEDSSQADVVSDTDVTHDVADADNDVDADDDGDGGSGDGDSGDTEDGSDAIDTDVEQGE